YTLKYDVLEKRCVDSPGEAFDTLCGIFPLQPIETKSGYLLALQIVTKSTEYLLAFDHESEAERGQILKYVDALGLLIEAYERDQFPKIGKKVTGAQVLEYLMQEHQLRQVDLKKELGGQSIVSEILSGKRKLNTNQIQALAKRFGVSPAVFFDF
ncbi:MAG TPA: helix-turn-helix domain-containing protein, partial [Bdellovibrionota bacterium]|nr:helix-turn-helix domain-containing protein [Bdellovibrionota bacterium]